MSGEKVAAPGGVINQDATRLGVMCDDAAVKFATALVRHQITFQCHYAMDKRVGQKLYKFTFNGPDWDRAWAVYQKEV